MKKQQFRNHERGTMNKVVDESKSSEIKGEQKTNASTYCNVNKKYTLDQNVSILVYLEHFLLPTGTIIPSELLLSTLCNKCYISDH